MTSPEPVPAPAAPLAEIVTTEGMTWSAIGVTAHVLAEEELAEEPAEEEADVVAELDDPAEEVQPATVPPTTSKVVAATHGSPRRRPQVGLDSLIALSLDRQPPVDSAGPGCTSPPASDRGPELTASQAPGARRLGGSCLPGDAVTALPGEN